MRISRLLTLAIGRLVAFSMNAGLVGVMGLDGGSGGTGGGRPGSIRSGDGKVRGVLGIAVRVGVGVAGTPRGGTGNCDADTDGERSGSLKMRMMVSVDRFASHDKELLSEGRDGLRVG
jgi:hypothetical protein